MENNINTWRTKSLEELIETVKSLQEKDYLEYKE